MPQIQFTDRKIANLPVPEKGQADYFDEGTKGFGIRVSYGGTKAWFIKYVHRGRQRRMTLGQYPAVKLADARKMALDAKHELVVEKTDPAARRRADREGLTFKGLIDLYMNEHAKPKKRSWREDERILDKYFKPWHARRAAEIERTEIAELLQSIKKDNGGIMANRCLATIRKMYSFALKNGKLALPYNPAQGLDRPAEETERDRVYSEDEIKRLWKAFGRSGVAGAVFKMILVTGQRLEEVKGMSRRDEIEGKIWTLPRTRTKNKRTHAVPLSDLALEILEETAPLSDLWAFPSPLSAERPIVNLSQAQADIRKLSKVRDFKSHDLRRTCATGITKLGFSRFIADRLLNHAEAGVGRVYDRHDYLKEKTEAANGWARHLRRLIEKDDNTDSRTSKSKASKA